MFAAGCDGGVRCSPDRRAPAYWPAGRLPFVHGKGLADELRTAPPRKDSDMTRLRTWTFVALAASSLGLAACSSSSSSSTTTTPASASTTPTTAVVIGTIAAPSTAGTTGTQPTIIVPTGAPPTQLESKDLIVGTGPAAMAGDKVSVQYVGVAYSSKQIFDSSWSRNQPFAFTLGNGTVIPGWDKGVVGMQVGGRRELIIPASLAYRDVSPGPGIAKNDTLIFIVDLVKIN
jgi:peptidylprolyl isomerase